MQRSRTSWVLCYQNICIKLGEDINSVSNYRKLLIAYIIERTVSMTSGTDDFRVCSSSTIDFTDTALAAT